jgi:hypothetical protein
MFKRDIVDNVHWTFIPDFIDPQFFAPLLEELKPLVGTAYEGTKNDGTKRISCKFANQGEGAMIDQSTREVSRLFSYGRLPLHDWSKSPTIQKIRDLVEAKHPGEYQYVLAHLYPTGASCIRWHLDSEALNSTVLSISLGATRKFRFRRAGETGKGDVELELRSGDAVYMKLGCQQALQHTVPAELRIHQPRINLTWRAYQK